MPLSVTLVDLFLAAIIVALASMIQLIIRGAWRHAAMAIALGVVCAIATLFFCMYALTFFSSNANYSCMCLAGAGSTALYAASAVRSLYR